MDDDGCRQSDEMEKSVPAVQPKDENLSLQTEVDSPESGDGGLASSLQDLSRGRRGPGRPKKDKLSPILKRLHRFVLLVIISYGSVFQEIV